ncbi:N-acetylmuramoyl-L-alanine amidase [Rufibacter radiotolerans]|uniref:N-acetylmuramoyl-L-alanine amidase n=1 Tax=Rufibacter radiotolerans TaxID=1379910 RepID=UPI00066474B1|nr:N-acetylmuramoyl-L-alanine amidase [Rufibacter radiotolerans]
MTKLLPLLSALLFCLSLSASAQGINPVRDTVVTVQPGQSYPLRLQKAGAIAVKCETCTLAGSYFLQGSDTLEIVPDPHEDQSALVSLESPGEAITFFSGGITGDLKLLFISSGTVKAAAKSKVAQREGNGECAFEVVPTSVWRAGLAEPTYTRSYTATKHVAVHHAAGSNTATDHYKVVRDIYLYHRNSNGWSDIGYNYLIAPDGTIFQGRDNPAGNFDHDYVLGAHLCSNNSNAMGICLLGDFTNTLPTQQAMDALYKVIKWKTKKDNIDVFGSTSHTIGPSSYMATAMMPNVLGHRDGCQTGYTACPGNLLYTKMADIRNQVNTICPTPLGISEPGAASLVIVYPNPTDGALLQTQFPWTSADIFTLGGRLVQTVSGKASQELKVDHLPAGVYLFNFQTPEFGKVVRRVVVQ